MLDTQKLVLSEAYRHMESIQESNPHSFVNSHGELELLESEE